MVDVIHQQDLQRRMRKAFNQRICDACRDHNRQTAVNPQTFEMRDGFQLCEQPVQLVIFRHQRIAAGENHLVQFRMRSNILKCSLPVTLIALIFGIGEVATEAIAAIYRAAAFDQQKRPVVVFMQQTRHYAMLFFQRVGGESGRDDKLILRGKYLTQKRIVRIAFLHAIDKWAGHTQGKQLFGAASGQQFFVRVYIQKTQKFIRIGHNIGKLR